MYFPYTSSKCGKMRKLENSVGASFLEHQYLNLVLLQYIFFSEVLMIFVYVPWLVVSTSYKLCL